MLLILQYAFAVLLYGILLVVAERRYPGELTLHQKTELIQFWKGYLGWVSFFAYLVSIGGLLLLLAWFLDGRDSEFSEFADILFPLHNALAYASDLSKINAMAFVAWTTFFLSLPLIFLSFKSFNPRVSEKCHYFDLFREDDEVVAGDLPPKPLLEETELQAIDQFVNDLLLQNDQTNPEGQA